MNWVLIMVSLLTLVQGYRMILHGIHFASASNPTPANVADVYDEETYVKWKQYNGEHSRLSIFSDLVGYVASVILLVSGAYAAAAKLFPAGIYWQMISVVLFDAIVSTLVHVGFHYVDTMVIEQKYGFNRSTMKTFVTDQIRNFGIEVLLSAVLGGLLAFLHQTMGDWMILLFAGAVFCLTLVISFLYPILSRIGNKFTPLEEGELKDRLMGLLTKHGYQVKAIEVMDASRRTTKLNAYFTGFGKMKTIVLYDNLVNAMSPDEICAVFAHELGHGIHKDIPKQQLMNLGNMLLMAVVIWLTVKEPLVHMAFGFNGINYGFAYILAGILLGLIQPLTGILTSAYTRRAEYRADAQAVAEGYGPALITALKKLAKENFAHLSPSPILVVLEYSHPPLSERIAAVEKLCGETTKN